jgi:hypothetical protein
MLDVFRKVTIAVKDKDSTTIATFDRMFEGIRKRMKSSVQKSITDAEQIFGKDRLEVRVLKSLLLVKYIKEFKADINNLTTLMIERFDQNKNELKEAIQKVLNKLESETYIQKVGITYEYLTDEEKDIENEIKNEPCGNEAINEEIKKILFAEILPDSKIKYEKTTQIIPITRKADDIKYGFDNGETVINVITPMNEDAGNVQKIKALKMHENEMTIILAPDYDVIKDIKFYLQTVQYSRQSRTESIKETKKKIIDNKIEQNQKRKKEIKIKLEELLCNATILVKSIETNSKGNVPKERIKKGFQELIEQTYTNLKMLNQKIYDEDDIKKCLNDGMRIGLETLQKEAQTEVISFMKNQIPGTRLTVKRITEHFKKIPYGWGENDIAYILTLLYRQNKIEFTSDSNLVEGVQLIEVLTTTQRKDNTVVKRLEDIPDWQKKQLTEFYKEFFNTPSSLDAKTLAIDTKDKIKKTIEQYKDIEIDAASLPFVKMLEGPIDHLKAIQDNAYTYFLSAVEDYSDQLLDDKEEIVDPIVKFLRSSHVDIYRQSRQFVDENRHNKDIVPDSKMDEIEAILTDTNCFKGDGMKRLKTLVQTEEDGINAILVNKRKTLKARMTKKQNKIICDPDYATLTETQQKEIEKDFVKENEKIEREKVIANLIVTKDRLENTFYPEEEQKMRKYTYINNDEPPPAEPESEKIKITEFMNNRFDDNCIKNKVELNRFIQQLKTELEEKIEAGKEIYIL